MRTLKYAILGMLSRRELTGYDMMKEFDRGLANFWYASHSQLYPELKRLAGEGLIQYETSIKGESLEKKIYRITPEGMEDLRQWLLDAGFTHVAIYGDRRQEPPADGEQRIYFAASREEP